ncbi:protein kinase domain-containing protein [Peribacillus faecalis]|nr:protein kinase family protein [Peribacillus faecalis]
MMMSNTTKNPSKVPPGTVINGKWNKNRYKVIRMLGAGANGTVYLADHQGQLVAIKMSSDYGSIASEMNVLKSFSKVQGSSLGPYLFHGDDWEHNGRSFPFYVMEYIQGDDLLSFIKKKGDDWVGILLLQLLASLDELHSQGWIFGDLKPENLIVMDASHSIRCIDVGGTTPIGRSVKEYTEFFDRGYWGLGTRKAEPSYDLFAVAMIGINVCYPNRFQKQSDRKRQLLEIVDKNVKLRPYNKVIRKALLGEYGSAKEMRRELLLSIQAKNDRRVKGSVTSKNVKSNKKNGGFAETFFILLIVGCIYGLYIFSQLTG